MNTTHFRMVTSSGQCVLELLGRAQQESQRVVLGMRQRGKVDRLAHGHLETNHPRSCKPLCRKPTSLSLLRHDGYPRSKVKRQEQYLDIHCSTTEQRSLITDPAYF